MLSKNLRVADCADSCNIHEEHQMTLEAALPNTKANQARGAAVSSRRVQSYFKHQLNTEPKALLCGANGEENNAKRHITGAVKGRQVSRPGVSSDKETGMASIRGVINPGRDGREVKRRVTGEGAMGAAERGSQDMVRGGEGWMGRGMRCF
ncbi:hypothetical protein E2C01_094824 [Portunus trituberculatus]|uniref:Uncharacterized protein n=1 Tax=Portunus trituberculatus TaxID=210409 RepID=A0A5B7JN69_PORTR|nr:hypothetical protein [Portunus trituberculatus]